MLRFQFAVVLVSVLAGAASLAVADGRGVTMPAIRPAPPATIPFALKGQATVTRGLPAAREKTSPDASSKVAVFNMVAVMREYRKAKYQIYKLGESKKKQTEEMSELKLEYTQLQKNVLTERNAEKKEAMQARMVDLARDIEDMNRQIEKRLNADAEKVIVELYDEIKEVVDGLAEENGFDIVFTYPDAATPEEMKSAYMKELKLKPAAALPFYVSRRIDLTQQVISELNTRNPSPDPPVAQPSVQPRGTNPRYPLPKSAPQATIPKAMD